MVKVEYIHADTGFLLRIKGHAGAGPIGADPVCAAVSILIYTAAQCALELYEDERLQQWPIVEIESGKSLVAADARQAHIGKVGQIFETVMTGFYLLAKQYPQYVTVKESSPEGLI